jgi:hypothetical protein
VAYPNFPDKHALDSIAEPAAFHRYWVDHGVLPAEHEAPDGVILLDQAPLPTPCWRAGWARCRPSRRAPAGPP